MVNASPQPVNMVNWTEHVTATGEHVENVTGDRAPSRAEARGPVQLSDLPIVRSRATQLTA